MRSILRMTNYPKVNNVTQSVRCCAEKKSHFFQLTPPPLPRSTPILEIFSVYAPGRPLPPPGAPSPLFKQGRGEGKE